MAAIGEGSYCSFLVLLATFAVASVTFAKDLDFGAIISFAKSLGLMISGCIGSVEEEERQG